MKSIIVYENKTIEYLPKLYANEFGQEIHFHIVDEDNNVQDLTGFTVKLTFESLKQGQSNLITLQPCTIVDKEIGHYKYTIVEGTLNISENAIYSAYLTLEKTSEKKEIIKLGYVKIYYK
ncbi:MAG: DUF2479 domain-containing protein [Spirochaetia bacterium]|nr:DUF2479 domain-containing protein [Spirochaetia bacterium]